MSHQTGSDSTYGNILISRVDANQVVFRVMACSDAQVALSQLPGIFTHYTYELLVGVESNSKTILKSAIGGATLTEVDSPQILDCQSERAFWISWKFGELSFGKGSVPEQGRMLYYQNSADWHDINALSFLTPAGTVGRWMTSAFSGSHSKRFKNSIELFHYSQSTVVCTE